MGQCDQSQHRVPWTGQPARLHDHPHFELWTQSPPRFPGEPVATSDGSSGSSFPPSLNLQHPASRSTTSTTSHHRLYPCVIPPLSQLSLSTVWQRTHPQRPFRHYSLIILIRIPT